MTSPLANFVTITFVLGEGAPVEVQPLDGQVFHFPPEYLTGLGSGAGDPGKIRGVRGYLDNSNQNDLKWVMTGPITNTTRTNILAIPGGLGWVDNTGNAGTPLRVFTAQMARLFNDFNVPGPDVLDMSNKMYDAASANRNAQIAAGG